MATDYWCANCGSILRRGSSVCDFTPKACGLRTFRVQPVSIGGVEVYERLDSSPHAAKTAEGAAEANALWFDGQACNILLGKTEYVVDVWPVGSPGETARFKINGRTVPAYCVGEVE